jgi:hypothetical protein
MHDVLRAPYLRLAVSALSAVVLLVGLLLGNDPAPARVTMTRVLFLYGSVPPGTDPGEMIRIGNTGRNGYAQLVAYLADQQGHNFEELQDTDPAVNPLTLQVLKPYDLVVLGSNNRRFSSKEAAVVASYVSEGGSILALSDSRFGLSPDREHNALGAGELSDNDVINQFGLRIEHDNYMTVDADATRFVTPTHPILSGVSSFRGEGVSLIKRLGPPAQILVRGNNLPLTNGDLTDDTYAITAIAQVGRGRVAATFDRNTWFNAGVGSDGTDIGELDNRRYAYTIFDWLVRQK